jgi:hypothetical protein
MRLSLCANFCAPLLLPCALGAQRAEPVAAQPRTACTFDACSLRIEPRFFRGEIIVVGNGREERPLGFTGRALVDLMTENEYAQREARIASTHRTRGGVISLISVAAWGTLGAIWLNRADRKTSDGTFIVGASALAIGGAWSGYHMLRDYQHSARAVWAYNRDLPR